MVGNYLKIFVYFGLGLSLPQLSYSIVTQRYINQLTSVFEKKLCSSDMSFDPMFLWEHGVYVAQVQGAFFYLPQTKTKNVSHKQPLDVIEKEWKQQHYHNFSFSGICPKQKKAYVVSMPAVGGFYAFDNKVFQFDRRDILNHCQQFKIYFADASKASVKQVSVINVSDAVTQINLNGYPDGTMGVVCYPRKPKDLGPQLWYLAPVGKGPGPTPPLVGYLYGGQEPEHNFMAWINALRYQNNLSRLQKFTASDSELNKLLTADLGVNHNWSLLKNAQKSLAPKGHVLIGEDRVMGKSQLEMAWLLWSSPLHRQFLLQEQARYIALRTQQTAYSRGLVIVLFR